MEAASTKKWKNKIALLILFYVFLNICFPMIEKMSLWGEAFVLITGFLLLTHAFPVAPSQKMIFLSMAAWMLFLPIYGILLSKLFWKNVFDPLYLVRHAVFFYYCIFFFYAYAYAPILVAFLQKIGKIILIFTPFAVLFLGANHAGSLVILELMLLSLTKNKRLFFIGLATSVFILCLSTGSGTNKFTLAWYFFFFALLYFARFWEKWLPDFFRRSVTWLLIAIAVFIFVKTIDSFYRLTTQMALLGESIGTLAPMSQEYKTDLGGFWRLVLWSHLYGRFLHFPWGVGIGTPLFENWLDGFVMLHLDKPGQNYVQGAHNSFVTLITRLGIPALLLLSMMFYQAGKLAKQAFRKTGFRPLQTETGRILTSSLLAFGSVCIGSSFNVVLESPLVAGNFWFAFGLFTRLFGDFVSGIDGQKENL